jgi:NADPH2:quinone reductase
MRDPAQHERYLAELFEMYQNGQVKPRITERFALEDAAKALSYVAERRALGKVVLTVD